MIKKDELIDMVIYLDGDNEPIVAEASEVT